MECPYAKKGLHPAAAAFSPYRSNGLLARNELISFVGRYNLLNELVSSGLFLLDHADHLGEGLRIGFLQGSNGFLCHGLLDLFVYGHTAKDGVVLLQLQTLGGILPVLGGDVSRSAWLPGSLMLRAFHDHLYAITLFCAGHCFACFTCPMGQRAAKVMDPTNTAKSSCLFSSDQLENEDAPRLEPQGAIAVQYSSVEVALFLGFLDRSTDADLVDRTHTCRTYPKRNGLVLLRDEIFPILQVGRERAARLAIGVGDFITGDDVLSGDLADL